MATSSGLPLPPVPFTKSFAQIVNDYAAAAQAQSETPLDFTEGSVFLALAEASGGNVDWLQKLYLFALLVERLQTSQGGWVDTFTADYMPPVDGSNSPRLPATPATGQVTFSRNNPQSQAIVPVGALVATFDGLQVYQVYADSTNSAFSATIINGGGFIIPAGQASLNVGVQALNPGTPGNALANTITLIRSPIVGIDTATNPAAFTTALDEETDAALKLRFKAFIASLAAGTVGAITYAIQSLQQGLQVAVHENIDPNGATDYGALTIYVDDGSGAPSNTLVQKASTAVTGVRAAGVRPQVLGATTLTASVILSVQINMSYNAQLVQGAVTNSVSAYVNDLGLENTLHITEIATIAYQASGGVTNVTGVSVNGTFFDLVPTMGQTIKIGTLTVNQIT